MYNFDSRNKEIYQVNFNLIMKGIIKMFLKDQSHSVVFLQQRMDCFSQTLHLEMWVGQELAQGNQMLSVFGIEKRRLERSEH